MASENKKGLSVLLMIDEYKRLELICKKLKTSKADFIRACLRKLPLDEEELTKWFESIEWGD